MVCVAKKTKNRKNVFEYTRSYLLWKVLLDINFIQQIFMQSLLVLPAVSCRKWSKSSRMCTFSIKFVHFMVICIPIIKSLNWKAIGHRYLVYMCLTWSMSSMLKDVHRCKCNCDIRCWICDCVNETHRWYLLTNRKYCDEGNSLDYSGHFL